MVSQVLGTPPKFRIIFEDRDSTLPTLCISESCIKIRINLNFYFQTSLWCLKWFYEGIKGLHKTFGGTKKKCENKNLR